MNTSHASASLSSHARPDRAQRAAQPGIELPSGHDTSVADAAVMYDAVKRMRVVPIGKGALVKILVPIVLPMIVVAALQIPLKQLLLTVVKALV